MKSRLRGVCGVKSMTRTEWESYITRTYGAEGEYLWARYPNYAVFRHSENRKWFAVMMEIHKEKLGLPEGGMIEVLNLKCNPILIGSLRIEAGFFPAYHMSKTSWITVALDGSAEEEKIKWLLDLSYNLTLSGKKRRE